MTQLQLTSPHSPRNCLMRTDPLAARPTSSSRDPGVAPHSSEILLAFLPFAREGKAMAPALFGAGDLYTPPVEVYVPPVGAPPTIVRDQRVFKHMGTLSRAGHW